MNFVDKFTKEAKIEQERREISLKQMKNEKRKALCFRKK